MQTPIVSTDWLADKLDGGETRLTLVDASWHMPDSKRDAEAEYNDAHLPGALFFDIDALSMQAFQLPHMMLRADLFEEAVSEMGVSSKDTIIVYDNSDVHSAARVWWNFKVMGHDAVYVLDGGLQKWRSEGKPLSDKPVSRKPGRFKATLRPELLRCQDDILMNLDHPREQLVDARGTDRFEGSVPEPRKGLRSGHIPGARNVPFNGLFASDNTLLPPEKLAEVFERAGVRLDAPVVTSCGSGITACVLKLALATLGKGDVAIYDGSWVEWGGIDHLPIDTGPASVS
jgi:thiosulfate/3-mercaptopyruvate sulfurtransferase